MSKQSFIAGLLLLALVSIPISSPAQIISNTIQLVYGLNEGFADITKAQGFAAIFDIFIQTISNVGLKGQPSFTIGVMISMLANMIDWILYTKT
jgi:hypothetical protein